MKRILLFFGLFISFSTFAQLTPVASKSFGTLVDLRAQSGTANTQVLLQGTNAVNDGNGGIYMWDDLSTATDDGIYVIKVTNVTTGRWLKMPNTNTVKGNSVFSGELLKTAYVVTHGLGLTPSQVYIQPTSASAAVVSWVSNKTSTAFTVNFLNVLNVGVNNITFDWLVIKY